MMKCRIKIVPKSKPTQVEVGRTPLVVGGKVNSVNGQTGDVVLDAEDVGAVPEQQIEQYPKKTELATVAFSGEYDDLEHEPTNFTEADWNLLWRT